MTPRTPYMPGPKAGTNDYSDDMRPRKAGDKCPACGGEIKYINAVEPWHPAQLQCEKCDGTWCIREDDDETGHG